MSVDTFPPCATAPILLLGAALTIMVGCVVVPGLTATAAGLGVSRGADWLVTLPSLGVILGSPLAGRMIAGPRGGAYRALAIGLAAYGLLGGVAPLLSGPIAVYADRLLLGVATALVMASGTTLIAAFWPDPVRRLRMIAAQGMAIELGGVVMLAVSGWLADRDWRLPFTLYLLAVPLLAAQLRWMPRPPAAPPPRDDGPSGARLPAAVFVIAGGAMGVFFVGVLFLPPALAAIGLSAAGTGYFLSFVSLVAVATAFLLPRVVVRLGEGRTFLSAFLAYAAAFTLFALAPRIGLAAYGAGGVLLGVGFGLSIPLANHAVIERSPPARRGPALARLSLAIFLGQFLASFAGFLPATALTVFPAAAVMALAFAVLAVRHGRPA
ncbi:MAG: MFS transporter [Azospirillaceae bacterium]|nr:MFS transporter [Azospirillaceae bacterium]